MSKPTPGEHKTVQARILAYAQEMGWTYVPRGEAETRRGFDHENATGAEQAAGASPYFDDLLDAQVRKLNPKFAEGPGALVGDPRRLHATIAGNRDFLGYLRELLFKAPETDKPTVLVLIDEAHRTTGGDLGNYRMAGVPNAVFIGFTGTPVDRTAFGRGTFKTFGTADPQDYPHIFDPGKHRGRHDAAFVLQLGAQ